MTEGAKFELPESLRLEEEKPRMPFSKRTLIASLAVNAVYHMTLAVLFVAIVASLIISQATQVSVVTLPMKFFNILAGTTSIEFVSAFLAYLAFRPTKRALLYFLYPTGLIGMFYALTIDPRLEFGFFSLVYYPSSFLIIVGGSYFALLLREAMYEDNIVKWATLGLMIYYFALALLPNLITLLSIVNFVSSILILYSLAQKPEVKVGGKS